jgi:hypothetical protein
MRELQTKPMELWSCKTLDVLVLYLIKKNIHMPSVLDYSTGFKTLIKNWAHGLLAAKPRTKATGREGRRHQKKTAWSWSVGWQGGCGVWYLVDTWLNGMPPPTASSSNARVVYFDISHSTSDAYSNVEFLGLIKNVLHHHETQTMRRFLNVLHGGNLKLQSKTEVFALLTGKIYSEESETLAACERLAKFDPAWMLTYGPAGDLPMHLAFLLGKEELGYRMLNCIMEVDDAVLDTYWDHCRRLRENHRDTIVTDIPLNRDRKALLGWILNLPYQSDVLWWFNEVSRREQVGGDGAAELLTYFNNFVPRRKWDEVLENDVGLFTGETLMHIAIQSLDRKLVDWLFTRGARMDARAQGLFFQPPQIKVLSDNTGSRLARWLGQPNMEVNTRAGCYYGQLPLSFAVSMGDVEMVKALIGFAKAILQQRERDGLVTSFTKWLDAETAKLMEESEGFHNCFVGTGRAQRQERRLSAFVNASDEHGNCALHMAALYHRKDVAAYLLQNSASPSLTLMNKMNRTPLTLALRSPPVFKAILKEGYQETVWQYGESQMTVISLYQVYYYTH